MKKKCQIPEYDLNPGWNGEEIADWGRRMEEAAPDLFRMSEFGRSREGRSIPLFTVTDFMSGDPGDKPGFYLQAMVHSHECGGLAAALFCARELVARHRRGGLLERTVFYIVPRINPDGAERILASAGCIRSRLDGRNSGRPNTWMEEDVNGDGLILEMRYPDPFGKWCADEHDPRVLLLRTPESCGPFYTLMQEGKFHQYDGSPVFRNGNTSLDWNRNCGSTWSAELADGGPFPFSEPETRLLAEFFASHRNLFGAVDFHNGPLQILSAPALHSRHLAPGDRELFENMRRVAEECGLEMSASCEYPLAHSGPDLPGNFVDWCYFDQGIPGWVMELGSIVSSLQPLSEHKKLDCSRAVYGQLLAWQEAHPEEETRLHEWKKFHHPQLGEVEIGGVEWRTYSLPGRTEMREYLRRILEFILRQAAMAPRLDARVESVFDCGGGVRRIRLRLFNCGELPTSMTARGARLPRCAPLYLEFAPNDGVTCLSMNRGQESAHLAGYESRYFEWFASGGPEGSILGTVLCRGGAAGNLRIEIPRNPVKSKKTVEK